MRGHVGEGGLERMEMVWRRRWRSVGCGPCTDLFIRPMGFQGLAAKDFNLTNMKMTENTFF